MLVSCHVFGVKITRFHGPFDDRNLEIEIDLSDGRDGKIMPFWDYRHLEDLLFFFFAFRYNNNNNSNINRFSSSSTNLHSCGKTIYVMILSYCCYFYFFKNVKRSYLHIFFQNSRIFFLLLQNSKINRWSIG